MAVVMGGGASEFRQRLIVFICLSLEKEITAGEDRFG